MWHAQGLPVATTTMGSKIRASMKNFTTLFLLAALALSCAPALAERADRDKPMTIDADALRHDDLKQITVCTGKVTVTKGTILTPEAGQLVFFRQKRDGVDEFMEGEGERIEYDSATDTVRILRRGELRRLVGATVADELSGNVIVYNNTTEVFTVDGLPGDPGRGGRVRAVLAPRAPAASATGSVISVASASTSSPRPCAVGPTMRATA